MGRQGGGVQREQEDERLLKDTRLAAQADQPDCSKEAQDGGGGGEARHATTETARGYTHTQIITPQKTHRV